MAKETTSVLTAVLHGSKAPTPQQLQRFTDFLTAKYHQPVQLTFEQNDALADGFILNAGDDVYDWSLEGRLRQFRERLEQLKPQSEKIIPLMKEAVENFTPEVLAQETGEVLTVGDEIATVRGLPHAAYGEILLFSNGVKGMVQDLKRDEIGCILFGDGDEISEGSIVRRTGKTAVALDTILNQKGKNVVCIYVAIGQKSSSVAQMVENLKARGAMDYTIVLHAPASSSASMQYIAPYAGCAMGEYFMYQGRDVLIVYDDLSKHAIAYRALSLLLERSPGREAYPGDVFYLHSRLLERSAHLSDELGGGSMTALPIVETQAGDVSAYIPTNIISITDGQIFLESDLFFSGQRPAVNVGISVSRVGGDAQTKAMKTAAGAIRLDLAQYREMEVFTQFSSDLDDTTKRQLQYGQGLMRLLRQAQYHPYSQHQQVILLVSALNHLFLPVPVDQVNTAAAQLLEHVEQKSPDLCSRIDSTGKLSDEDRDQITSLAKAFLTEAFAGKCGA